MKQITFEFSKKTPKDKLDDIIEDIKMNFDLLEDSDERFENLRFVTISGYGIEIDVNGECIELRKILNLHAFVSIPRNYIYQLDLVM